MSRPALAVLTLAAAVAPLAAPLATPLAAQSPERHVLRGPIVTVWNLAGRAEVVAGSGSDVVVELTRGGDDGRRLTVEATSDRLVVKYPAREIVYRGRDDAHNYNTTLLVSEDGTFAGGWDDDRDGRRVRISGNGGGLEAYADLRIAVPTGQRVAVNLGVGSIEVANVNGVLELRTYASAIRARGARGRLSARTGSGRILLEDVQVDRLNAATGSGSIDLIGVRSDELRVSTGSGSIEGRDVRGARLDASTGSGGVRLESLTSDEVRASTGSGSVRLDFSTVPRDLTARTGSGSVTLGLPRDPNVDVDVRTGSGGISSDFPVTMDQVRRNELRGRIGTGADGRIRVSTGSGGVRLERR
jgi:hypothetical protein